VSDFLQVVVLAAGKGTRLKNRRPKVLQRAGGAPLIEHVLRAIDGLRPLDLVVVVGHEGAEVAAALAAHNPRVVHQEPQLGTGHALLVARPALREDGTVLVLSGDVPLVRPATLAQLVERHRQDGAAATLLTAYLTEPGAYGRVIRGHDGRPCAIVEARDATDAELQVHEVNAGLYAFASAALFKALDELRPQNAQGEYYLTDVVGVLAREGQKLGAVTLVDPRELLGVNTQAELAQIDSLLRERRAHELMAAGVVLQDPGSIHIGLDVRVEADAIIRPFTLLEGTTTIASGAVIGPFARLENARVGAGAQILDHCVLRDCEVEAGAAVGPFAHVRPESRIGRGARVGNFVELKKTVLGEGSKASHLSYLGDAIIGANVNIGAGTITCNYDGTHKHITRIEDGAFVGSDSTLVAPVTVGAGAYVAAGSTITSDVPDGALGLGRARQVVKQGWASARREREGGGHKP
jgi:bifunctional UDP-N-acetylglucosamine pyrophosphorylase / glucosamine-1-phosphate N-acetyltransferase